MNRFVTGQCDDAKCVAGLGLATLLGLVLASAACSEPDWVGGDLPPTKTEPAANSPESCDDGSSAGAEGAGGGGIDVDISTLAACCETDGKAHCVPDDKVSASSREKLTKCEGGAGGVCLPDNLILGKPPKSCQAANGLGEGVCLSPCIKSVGDNRSLLQQTTCDPGELCAPCVRPGGERTGACEIGGGKKPPSESKSGSSCAKKKQDAPADGGSSSAPSPSPTPSGSATCCGDKGACVPESAVPEERKENLEQKECDTGKLCAPKENIDKNFKPKRCTGETFSGSYDGVCLSNCLKFDFLQSSASEQGSCDADHRCMPCETFGSPTGAPGCE